MPPLTGSVRTTSAAPPAVRTHADPWFPIPVLRAVTLPPGAAGAVSSPRCPRRRADDLPVMATADLLPRRQLLPASTSPCRGPTPRSRRSSTGGQRGFPSLLVGLPDALRYLLVLARGIRTPSAASNVHRNGAAFNRSRTNGHVRSIRCGTAYIAGPSRRDRARERVFRSPLLRSGRCSTLRVAPGLLAVASSVYSDFETLERRLEATTAGTSPLSGLTSRSPSATTQRRLVLHRVYCQTTRQPGSARNQ